MNLADFICDLQRQGIHLSADGDRLRCNAPAGALTADLREEMKRRKPEILAFLRAAETLVQQQPAIVPLQPHGITTPIMAVAGHNGDVFAYRALAQQLGSDQPFFGLRPPGLDGDTQPIARVEDLAKYFADQIVAFRPGGEVILAGYCAGGTIAYELAQQLTSRGIHVAFIAMFGCPYPTMYRFMKPRLLAAKAWSRIGQLARKPGMAEWREHIMSAFRVVRRQVSAVEADTDGETAEVIARRQVLEHVTVDAVKRYVPQPFAGHVHLFLPNADWVRHPARPLRWRALAKASTISTGPDHGDWDLMLRPAGVDDTAALFRQARDQHRAAAPLRSQDHPTLPSQTPAALTLRTN
jgi:thioesterase domain-containing protein